MALAEQLNTLTEALIEQVTGLRANRNVRDATRLRETILKGLREHNYLRTNPFEVEEKLDGLEERFHVNGREGLAEALRLGREHLDLQHPSKWNPEILSLLLELSDQPTSRTLLEDVENLRTTAGITEPTRSLRWEEIAVEDGWREEAELWRNIHYSDSSDYESSADDEEGDQYNSQASTISEFSTEFARDIVVDKSDHVSLRLIKEAQAWRFDPGLREEKSSAKAASISELAVTQEILFMLQGLPTTLFGADRTPNSLYQSRHLCPETHLDVVETFADYGRHVQTVRTFSLKRERDSHIQAFQDSTNKCLTRLDEQLMSIQSQLTDPSGDVVMSLAQLENKICTALGPALSLARVIQQAEAVSSTNPFRFLDTLYLETLEAQLSARTQTYEFLCQVFLESFNVYLRPVHRWMCEGELSSNDSFFITILCQTSIQNIWRDQFGLSLGADGKLFAPQFLNLAAQKIFNAGKTVVVLKRLKKYAGMRSATSTGLTYENICPRNTALAPFAHRFEMALQDWIQPRYGKASEDLRAALLGSCNLKSHLAALQQTYLQADGFAASGFCNSISSRIDTLDTRWFDRHTLTGLARELWGSSAALINLSVSLAPEGTQHSVGQAQKSIRNALADVKVHSRPPWPIRMILSSESMEHYQSAFTFLLQIRRAAYLLHRTKISDKHRNDALSHPQQAGYFSCRRNLTWFTSTLHTYLATIVLGPNITQLSIDMESAQDIDAMIQVHDAFAKRIISEACLGSRLAPIHDSILEVLDMALRLELTPLDSGGAYSEMLSDIAAGFRQQIRFIREGLRSVSRATSDASSVTWGLFADKLAVDREDLHH